MARAYVYNMVDTWNAGGTTFTAVKMNVTDTASAAASALIDLQVGGVSQFKVSKAGAVTAVGVAIPTISSTDTLSNKTLSSPTLSGTVAGTPTFSGAVQFARLNTTTTDNRAIYARQWADISDNFSGFAHIGSNLYSKPDTSTYITPNSHPSIGYSALRMAAGFLEFAGVATATTAGATVTPTWVAVPTISSTDTLSNKTLSSPTLSGTVAGTPTFSGTITLADAVDIAVGTTTGTKIGTATTQKLGFFNKTPVVQPTAVADATDAASVITQLNALLTRMRNLGLIAT